MISPMFFCLLLSCLRNVWSGEWFIAVDGTADGSGTIDDPWDIVTAFQTKSPPYGDEIHPGDTVWVRGGLYRGVAQRAKFRGTKENPIIVRNYNGERVRIDGEDAPDHYPLYVQGEYTWYWGFELFVGWENHRDRSLDPDPQHASCIYEEARGNKYINNICHDSQRFGMQSSDRVSFESEFYGNIIFYTGFDSQIDRTMGHAFYVQNEAVLGGYKVVRDNVCFKTMSTNFHMWAGGSSGFLENMIVDGNIVFDAGALSAFGPHYNVNFGGYADVQLKHSRFTNNVAYFGPNLIDQKMNVNLGYDGGSLNLTVRNNVLAHHTRGIDTLCVSCRNLPAIDLKMDGNFLDGAIAGFTEAEYPDNEYHVETDPRPTANVIVVRPNQYEPGERGHIAVMNYEGLESVEVDISSMIYPPSRCYSIYDVENLFGNPIASGKVPSSGGAISVSIPMDLTEVTPVLGTNVGNPVVHTESEFGAFLVTNECRGSNAGTIAGITVGVIAGVAIVGILVAVIVIIVVFLMKRKSRESHHSNDRKMTDV